LKPSQPSFRIQGDPLLAKQGVSWRLGHQITYRTRKVKARHAVWQAFKPRVQSDYRRSATSSEVAAWLAALPWQAILQDAWWAVASIAAIAAAWKGLAEFVKRGCGAGPSSPAILDAAFADSRCNSAMAMVDWSNQVLQVESGERVRITRDEVFTALRSSEQDLSFSSKEVFVRDCFDSLLDALQRLEHYISTRLIDYKDVEYPLAYIVEELSGICSQVDSYIPA
jgi:hypothetical protein